MNISIDVPRVVDEATELDDESEEAKPMKPVQSHAQDKQPELR